MQNSKRVEIIQANALTNIWLFAALAITSGVIFATGLFGYSLDFLRSFLVEGHVVSYFPWAWGEGVSTYSSAQNLAFAAVMVWIVDISVSIPLLYLTIQKFLGAVSFSARRLAGSESLLTAPKV
jgi:hypothetical protein